MRSIAKADERLGRFVQVGGMRVALREAYPNARSVWHSTLGAIQKIIDMDPNGAFALGILAAGKISRGSRGHGYVLVHTTLGCRPRPLAPLRAPGEGKRSEAWLQKLEVYQAEERAWEEETFNAAVSGQRVTNLLIPVGDDQERITGLPGLEEALQDARERQR